MGNQKLGHYLQQHLLGEVTTSPDALEYFSTDASILQLKPSVAVYPRNTSDVRKVARFAWQLAERGRVVPITARGKGSDYSGAAIGSGIMLVMTAHLNKIMEVDNTSTIVQSGLILSKLQQTLHTHRRFIPAIPLSSEFATVGGAIANNAAGPNSVKYGEMRKQVNSLTVVLANGELVKTGRLSKRELKKRESHTTLEAEIYRELDRLLTEKAEIIQTFSDNEQRSAVGYALSEVRKKDGSMDLTPLFVGSQGTLGIVTQAELKTEEYNPHTVMGVCYLDRLAGAEELIAEIKKLKPSAFEFVDETLLKLVNEHNPNQLKSSLESETMPKLILLAEFDDLSERTQKRKLRQMRKLFKDAGADYRLTADELDREELWKLRDAAATALWYGDGSLRAVPIIEDAIVPCDKVVDFVRDLHKLFDTHRFRGVIWGHAGDGHVHAFPLANMANISDRQRLFALAEAFYALVRTYGGNATGAHNDGRLRGAFLEAAVGAELYDVFNQVKKIFDPHGILNPGVKVGVDSAALTGMVRRTYSLGHFFDHLPRL